MPRHSVEPWSTVMKIGGLALAGHGRGQVRAPHLVDPFGPDRAVVGLRAVRPADPAWRQQAMRPRQPQDAALGRADAGEAQSCPDFAVALAVEGARGQQLADRVDQGRVGHRSERARPTPGAWFVVPAMTIQRGPRRAPDPGHPKNAVGPVRGGRSHHAHGLDLRRAKGRPVSSCSIFTSSSSLAMVRSPTFAFRRPISTSRPSAGRDFSDASPAARKRGAPSTQLGRRQPKIPRHQLHILARATAAARRSACAWPTSAGAALALARLRQRDGRAPPGQRPVPSCPSCSPPCSPSLNTRRCLIYL